MRIPGRLRQQKKDKLLEAVWGWGLQKKKKVLSASVLAELSSQRNGKVEGRMTGEQKCDWSRLWLKQRGMCAGVY